MLVGKLHVLCRCTQIECSMFLRADNFSVFTIEHNFHTRVSWAELVPALQMRESLLRAELVMFLSFTT